MDLRTADGELILVSGRVDLGKFTLGAACLVLLEPIDSIGDAGNSTSAERATEPISHRESRMAYESQFAFMMNASVCSCASRETSWAVCA